LGVARVSGSETVLAVSKQRRALSCAVEEVNYLSGAGRGVTLMKLGPDDELLGFIAAGSPTDALEVRTSLGGVQRIAAGKGEASARGGKGREVIKRGSFTEIVPGEVSVPASLSSESGEAS
jgi:DNA gyrase subunit A